MHIHGQPLAVDYYIGANVELAPGVVVAAGCVLEAAPGARLVIASGVCIGTGAVIQAVGGKLTLGTEVNLGAGVLIVGRGTVNPRACIGSESTLFNPHIDSGTVLPAKSLVGMPAGLPGDRPSETAPPTETNGDGSATDVPTPDVIPDNHQPLNGNTPGKTVYGREQVMQLMKTLFPHRDALDSSPERDAEVNN
ncbi:MAG: hypothetical protein ACFBSG_13905 [Leptolyngbyaceae cyanobacterium]